MRYAIAIAATLVLGCSGLASSAERASDLIASYDRDWDTCLGGPPEDQDVKRACIRMEHEVASLTAAGYHHVRDDSRERGFRWVQASSDVPNKRQDSRSNAFPTQLQGLWAESPVTCQRIRDLASERPKDRAWLQIDAIQVRGTTEARFTKAMSARSAQAVDTTNSNILVNFKLEDSGALREQIDGARAWMLYVPCKQF